LPEDISAQELFGLTPGFTKSQLRAAWLRLARELHPDRWSAAAPAARKMKEAALQRVNAARDELAPQAL
jgi:curved DNA-binding protein CbpA